MEKIDLKKEFKHLYKPSAQEVVEVEVPAFKYLMVDGIGDPETSSDYAQAIEALFAVSHATKAIYKKQFDKNYVVMPLEGLWWADDLSVFETGDKSQWQWTLMIMQPDFVGNDIIDTAMTEVQIKKSLPALAKMRLETLAEERCAQIMHVGPFDQQGPTIEKVRHFIDSRALRTGKHHEIYLSDIKRADPKNWKTVVRHQMLSIYR